MDAVEAARLAKLLKFLRPNHDGTFNDGEVLAAARKIAGVVAAHDVDWDAVLCGQAVDLTKEQLQRVYDAGYQKGVADASAKPRDRDEWAAAGTPRTGEVGGRRDEVMAVMEAAGRANLDGKLSEFERSFSLSMAERVDSWGGRAYVSEKQWAVIDRLRRKLEREGYL